LSSGDYYDQMVILFILYGFSMIAFSYFFNFLFDDFGSAQTWIFLAYIFSGTILTVVIYILRLFEDTLYYSINFSYAFKLFPPYLFGCTILGNLL